ncbi:MAG TPA: mechanosensitive ion channel domain-containing protein, partial [Rhizomicrobium sp.]
MNATHMSLLRPLSWHDLALVVGILLAAQLLVLTTRWTVRRAAERAPPQRRLLILRASPIARLVIGITCIVLVVPILVEPNFEEIVALAAAAGLALAFALKDYVSSLIAGVATILENTYQPGDWIEIGGTYGEVTAIGLRAVHLVTADDTEVIVPHDWTAKIANASSGSRSMLCVANFYLEADHDGGGVCAMLADVG